MKNIFESAIKEVMDTGMLSLPTRKRIWLSYGELDTKAMEHPTEIKDGCIKRIELAKHCVEKVLPEWEKRYKYDLRPQKILSLVDDYLNQKVELLEIESLRNSFTDEVILLMNNNPTGVAYEVGWAAIDVSYFLFHDEPLFEEDEYPECSDEELDSDMWDASYRVYLVYVGADETATEEMRKIKGLEFWLWYIEQAGKIAEVKDISKKVELYYKKVKDLIIENESKKSDIDEGISLENFVNYIDDDCKYERYEIDKDNIRIITVLKRDTANCIYCNQPSTRIKFEHTTAMEIPLLNKDNKKVYLIQKNRSFYCDNDKCAKKFFYEKRKLFRELMSNFKRYLSDEKRKNEILRLLGM